MERIAPVSRAEIDRGARERAGEVSDLTDVDIDEALPDELAHPQMLAPPLSLSRGVDRLIRVLDQALGPADRARDVEATIEVPEVLRGLESLLERGLREAQRRPESLKLAVIDLRGRHQPQMLPSVA